MPRTDAFDITASRLKGTFADVRSYDDLASWLSQEIESAIAARSGIESEIRYAWALYEQQRTRTAPPWPNAADLTSPIAREAVDALQARIMQTIFVDPVWTVEGWGEAATRAPFVEEFHQRTLEEERLQTYLDEVTQRCLIEGVGILRTSESYELRREKKRLRAQWQTDETGAPVMGEDHLPLIARDEAGNPVEATDPEMSVEGDFDVVEPVRVGPAYMVVPYLDQVVLPGHAQARTQVWGEAFRFYRRVPELQALAARGVYDKASVTFLGEGNEKDQTATDVPNTRTVADQRGPTAQKELWEVAFLADLDGQGERWWLATLSVEHRRLLRLKQDDRTSRTVRFIPFPKAGTVDRGYSLVTDVGRTVIEEDTAVRNMRADKATLAIAAPILKRSGALWDEYEQPMGPRAVITVRDKDEVTQMQLSDVPQSINIWKSDVRQDADRLFGQNDTSLGVDSGEDNTLGEERLRAGYVEIRMDLIIKRLKEPMEELFQIRHAIWKRTLAGQQGSVPGVVQRALTGVSSKGTEAVFGAQAQGVSFTSINDGRVIAQMLEGAFWGKPRGSVETADLGRQMQSWLGFLKVIPALTQFNQMFGVVLQTPQAAKAIMEQTLRVFRVPDKQAFLGPEAQQAMVQFQARQQLMADPRMQMLMSMMGGSGPEAGAPGPQGPPPEPPMGAVQ